MKTMIAILEKMRNRKGRAGFTLIETLVAISILSLSLVGPMSLATQSLVTADYARDQITAFYLAQEAIEAVRSVRDTQILRIINDPEGSYDLFGSIPVGNTPFIINAFNGAVRSDFSACPGGEVPPFKTGVPEPLYTYGTDPCILNGTDGTPSRFTSVLRATVVNDDELRITSTVSWKKGSVTVRSFTITENLYRWVEGG